MTSKPITARQLRNGLAYVRAAEENLRLAQHYFIDDAQSHSDMHNIVNSLGNVRASIEAREKAIPDPDRK